MNVVTYFRRLWYRVKERHSRIKREKEERKKRETWNQLFAFRATWDILQHHAAVGLKKHPELRLQIARYLGGERVESLEPSQAKSFRAFGRKISRRDRR
jgi:hypothetical protein